MSFCTQHITLAQAEFELKPNESMSITGKGSGQDAMNNPYAGQNCFAIVKNTGESIFSIRTQKNGEIIETIRIAKGEIKKVTLLKGYELYLDAKAKGKATLKFEKMDE